MISITKLTVGGKNRAKGRGARSVVEYMAATEYYADKGIGQAKWEGAGAERLGLHGKTQDEQSKDFEALLKAQHPETGETLGRGINPESKKSQLMAIDLTFNAPKAFTLAYALADETTKAQILEAHTQARKQALELLLSQPVLRRGANADRVEVAEAPVLRVVTHIDNRNGEAHLHDHCVLLAKTQASDGKWLTVDNQALCLANHAASSIYDRAFAEGMERLGFIVEKKRSYDGKKNEKPNISYHIAGISDALEQATSSRSEEATNLARELGITKQEAILRTRQGKEDLTPEEVLNNTLAKAKEHGLEGIEALRFAKRQREPFEPKTPDELLKNLHRTDSSFTRFELIDALAKEGYDKPLETADTWLKAHCLEFEQQVVGSSLYCSKAQYEMEIGLVARAKARGHETFHHLDREVVDKAIKEHETRQGFELSPEQRKAVDFVTMETGGVACIEGFAGAGKSASAGAYCLAFEASGFKVLGTSMGQGATDNLATEAKIEAYNCTDLLNRLEGKNGKPKLELTAQHVLLVDEAGMVDANTMMKLQDAVDAKGAKLVLVGDTFQLQPVGAGEAFRLITEDSGKFQQTEIKRQKWEEGLQQAKDFYSGKKGEDIVSDWLKKGTLTEHDEKEDSIKALVKDYFSSKQPVEQRLVLVNTNADALMVSKRLREGLMAEGVLDQSQTRSLQVQDPDSYEKTMKLDVAVGERLRFTNGYKNREEGLVVANNSKGTVLGFNEGKDGLAVRLKLETTSEATNGKEVEIPLAKFKHFTYGWTSTNHSAQGLGANDVFWLDGGGKVDRNMGLVAFTRSKQSFKAYTTDAEALGEHMSEWGKKPASSELTLKKNPEYNVDLMKLGAEVVASATSHKNAPNRYSIIQNELVETRRKELIKARETADARWLELEAQMRKAKDESPERKKYVEAKNEEHKAKRDLDKAEAMIEEHKKSGSIDQATNWLFGKGLKALEEKRDEANKAYETSKALAQSEKNTYTQWKNRTFSKQIAEQGDCQRTMERWQNAETMQPFKILESMSEERKKRFFEKRLSPKDREDLKKPTLLQRLKEKAREEELREKLKQIPSLDSFTKPFEGQFERPILQKEEKRKKDMGRSW